MVFLFGTAATADETRKSINEINDSLDRIEELLPDLVVDDKEYQNLITGMQEVRVVLTTVYNRLQVIRQRQKKIKETVIPPQGELTDPPPAAIL